MFLDKYESTGNDFLITSFSVLEKEGIELSAEILSAIARKVCDRNFGIGADGLMILDETKQDRPGFGTYQSDPKADVRFYGMNSDGSQFEMSGNGFRCFALFASENGFGLIDTPGAKRVSAETLAGTKSVLLNKKDNQNSGVVDMGEVIFDKDRIPFIGENPLEVEIELLGKVRKGVAVNTGIPHWVIFLDNLDELNSNELADQALAARFDPRFPRNTNVSVAVVESRSRASTRIFERGANETLSCGTGATAIAGACYELGIADQSMTISLPGGELNAYLGKTAQLSGPVNFIARCEIDIK